MLYMIGIGLNDEKDISVKGLECVKKCELVFLESYTSLLQCNIERLEKLYGKKIIPADRDLVEKEAEKRILEPAKNSDVAFLVIGDVFSATTHTDLRLRAKELCIKVQIVHNASVLTAIGITGLELYKFGKVSSIPFENENVITPYKVLSDNKNLGYHTLLLLDIKADLDKYMTVQQAIEYLLGVEEEKKEGLFTKDTMCVGCARLGSDDVIVKYGKASELINVDFGKAPHCLIVPGNLHFIEEEALEEWE